MTRVLEERGEWRGGQCDPTLAGGRGLQLGIWQESQAQGRGTGGECCDYAGPWIMPSLV
jgi:hypothetical protein